jgi:sarcosine oxidase gamma subunit
VAVPLRFMIVFAPRLLRAALRVGYRRNHQELQQTNAVIVKTAVPQSPAGREATLLRTKRTTIALSPDEWLIGMCGAQYNHGLFDWRQRVAELAFSGLPSARRQT